MPPADVGSSPDDSTTGGEHDGPMTNATRIAVSIDAATTRHQLDDVRRLWAEFRGWLSRRYAGADRWVIEAYFDDAAWRRDLDDLPGPYQPSRGGALLLAGHDGRAVGTVALRALDPARCEVKRLYVAEDARGLGVGRALVDAVVAGATVLGYQEIVLDTGFLQHEATSLYRARGFEESGPPYPVDPRLAAEGLTFLRRRLHR